MRQSHSLIALTMLLASAARVTAQSALSADSTYAEMVKRVTAGDTTVDFQAFRIAYAHSTAYDPMSISRMELRKRLNAALNEGDTKLATVRADSLLASNYTDINAHVIRSSLARQAQDAQTSSLHAAIARGLMRSLDLEHRGASSANAILLVDPDEENVYGLITGLQRTAKYSTAQCGQRVCDSTIYRDPRSGRDTTIVFDITLIAQKALGGKP